MHDDAKRPRYIATVHRRGFRFLAEVQGPRSQVHSLRSPFPIPHSAFNLVGREPDLTFLHERLVRALHGARQIVFVTGEPGIGKTTLLEAFVAGVQDQEKSQKSKGSLPQSAIRHPHSAIAGVWVGRGQCVEHYGAGEAYLPVLEAVGRLCREAGGERLIALLSQHAPSWLVQMPGSLRPAELEALQQLTAGATRERMLRELAEAVEALTADRPLVLVLEDLHWSDASTLDLLSVLARRQESARLLVVATYRPVEILTRDHPLKAIKQELQVHGQCEELAIDFLTGAHVAEYLAMRFTNRPAHPSALPRGEREPAVAELFYKLARIIHRRTDGNPLFMVNVVNDLIVQGVMVQTKGGWEIRGEVKELTVETPINLRQMIERQITRVSPEERKVLEAASMAGADFSAASVTGE